VRSKIVVDKDQLLDTLKDNRDTHRTAFMAAMDKFRTLAIERFEENIEEIKRGGPVRTFLELPVPEEHTKDYDRAIMMLEWDKGTEVELSEVEFAQYVEDDWGWQQSFASNTMSYTSMGNGGG